MQVNEKEKYHVHQHILKMELKASYRTATTAINNNGNGGISCRRCLHHRRHQHRTTRGSSPGNINENASVVGAFTFSSTTHRNGECQKNLEETLVVTTGSTKHCDDTEGKQSTVFEEGSRDRKCYFFDRSSSSSSSPFRFTPPKSMTEERRKQVQLNEITCQQQQQYCFNLNRTQGAFTNFPNDHKPRFNTCNHKPCTYKGQNAAVENNINSNMTLSSKHVIKSSHHRNVIFSLINLKMTAVIVQISLLAFSLLPIIQASSLPTVLTSSATSSETDYFYNETTQQLHPFLSGVPKEPTQRTRFVTRHATHRLASAAQSVSQSAAATPTGQTEELNPKDTSYPSTMMNDAIHTDNYNDSGEENNNNSGGVGENLPQEDVKKKIDVTRKRTTMKMNTGSDGGGGGAAVGIPFVRAHSTGFISLVNGDRSTKESSLLGGVGGGNLMMLIPQLVGIGGSGDDSSSRGLTQYGPCTCWNTTDGGQKREVECKCGGPDMTHVNSSLPQDIHRLTVEQAANFTTLASDELRTYGNSLSELVLSELPAFHEIKNGTFLGMKKLNTIYIHGTPALTQISESVFNVYLPELKIIRITHSSLEVVPNLSQLRIKRAAALHMVEIENNKISRLIPGSFNGLTVEHLALSYNSLEEIGPSAFAGSTIARLTLKGNPLKVLHSKSFVGIDSLRVLDLSETKITYLPTEGLGGLESLRLEKVWTLSVIPSIYHFRVLEEAWLTWPYHCCAFEYPQFHDPVAYQKYQDYVRNVVNELCAKASANGSVSSTEFPQKINDGIGDGGEGNDSTSSGFQNELNASLSSQRHKRHLRLFEQANMLRGPGNTGASLQHRGRKMLTLPSFPSLESNLNENRKREDFWSNANTQTPKNNIYKNIFDDDYHVNSERDAFLRKLISTSPLVTATSTSNSRSSGATDPNMFPSRNFVRLKKRSATGNHPRQAQKRNSGLSIGKNEEGKEKAGSVSTDGFHHPHVQHGSGIGSSSSGGNPSPHPFDNDDEPTLPFGKVESADTYDPFVFDPDQSFGILDPNDLQHESDILGKNTWGTFGHASEVEFDEDIGVFHPSVTPAPTVITLCGNVAIRKPSKILCHPQPDAFNPCEDIMGSIWLRGAVWVVVTLALVGNSAVLIVLLLAPGRISVQRFLMANLSWADLCMGIYLLMVATQDLVSLGSYFNYAIDWQLGWGCQIAGFLTVFASELSVFTLAVITGERWYALTRAIHLTKRLTLLGAAQLMAFGWFMAILLAALPLMGVSSFSKTSICLPMEAHTGGAVAYLIFLLLFNGVAFLLVACAYWQMYRAVAGHGGSGGGAAPAASSADTAIAKKMALLVFTDFFCWAPVAFFGLTAVGGMPLIGVTDAKILLVFFYPLNACCNPYLYAILTKQYRRDLLLLLSRHGLCTKRAARYKTGAASTNNTMQTMQTVLRMGSMTETKVAGGGGSGRGSVLVNGGRSSVSVAATNNSLEDEGLLLMSSRTGNSTTQNKLNKEPHPVKNELLHQPQVNILDHPLQPKHHHSQSLKSSCEDFRKALNLHPPPIDDDEDDDVFDINGLSGRHIAETTFISIPITVSSTAAGATGKNKKFGESGSAQEKVGTNGDPAKEKLIQHVVEQHSHQQHDKKAAAVNPPSTNNAKDKLTNDTNSRFVSSGKEEHDLEHEITETTPFCK